MLPFFVLTYYVCKLSLTSQFGNNKACNIKVFTIFNSLPKDSLQEESLSIFENPNLP